MASKLKPLMSHGKRPWSYLTSSLSSSKSLPLHPIPDPTGDPPAAQAGDTPPVEQPTPAPAGLQTGSDKGSLLEGAVVHQQPAIQVNDADRRMPGSGPLRITEEEHDEEGAGEKPVPDGDDRMQE